MPTYLMAKAFDLFASHFQVSGWFGEFQQFSRMKNFRHNRKKTNSGMAKSFFDIDFLFSNLRNFRMWKSTIYRLSCDYWWIILNPLFAGSYQFFHQMSKCLCVWADFNRSVRRISGFHYVAFVRGQNTIWFRDCDIQCLMKVLQRSDSPSNQL